VNNVDAAAIGGNIMSPRGGREGPPARGPLCKKETIVAEFHHVGVPVKKKQPNETYLAAGKVYLTDPEKHTYRVECLRFEKGAPLPKELQTMPHVAYHVAKVDAAVKGEKVILPPMDVSPALRVAFILKDGLLIEVMQAK
jgi:glyoxylase I family protein